MSCKSNAADKPHSSTQDPPDLVLGTNQPRPLMATSAPFWSTILPPRVVSSGCTARALLACGADAAEAAAAGPKSSGAGAIGRPVEMSGRTGAPCASV
jgi:hypothetical protein